MLHHFRMPKVYSYTRFSTPEQAAGDSERRQVEAAKKFAAEHGLDLDDRLQIADLGVSAYRGANQAKTAGLGQFLDAVKEGQVEEGSILLLESLDRFSRMEPLLVQHELTGLLIAGVQVATLTDGKIYSRESLAKDNALGLMIALMVAIRAHEESQTKGRRVAAAWAQKRKEMREGKAAKLTSKAPAWLRWTDDAWTIDEARADIVRRMYALTLAGEGEHKIAERFNREGVPPLGRGKRWHRSSVAKLLRNRAVIGDLVPGHMEFKEDENRKIMRLRVLEDPIPGAFPAIISEEDWQAVRVLKDGRAGAVRGIAAARPLGNVLAGLARCPLCGSTMTRVSKGPNGGAAKLVCTRAKAGAGCQYKSVPLAEVEDAILNKADRLISDVPTGDRGGSLDSAAFALESAISGTSDHMRDLSDALAAHPSQAGARRLAQLEAELRTHEAALRELDEERRLVDGGLIVARAERLHMAIEAAREEGDSFTDREPINAALKVLFDGVTVDYRSKRLLFHWRQGGESEMLYAWPGDS